MNKRYLVIGGYIISKNDGDKHYVSAPTLCRLYGVNTMECVLADELRPDSMLDLPENLIILRPRYDGIYVLEQL